MEQQLLNGLYIGSIYVLIAIGYTLIFGILQVIFFAQGELSMIAAFGALIMYNVFFRNSLYPPLLQIAAMTIVASVFAIIAGLLAERIALRPVRNSSKIKALITSLGLSIVFQNIIMLIYGPQNYFFPNVIENKAFTVGGVSISQIQLSIFVTAIILIATLELFFKYNKYGLSIRALAQNQRGAQLMGIEVNKTIRVMFIISSTTAAIAGICMGISYGVAKFDMGFIPGIKGFTVAILGGVGNLKGAFIAGLLLGIGEALFSGYISTDYKDFLVFLLLLFILLIRPQGLLGVKR